MFVFCISEPYKIIALDQNTNADSKTNLNFILPFQEVQLFRLFCVDLLLTSYTENSAFRLLVLLQHECSYKHKVTTWYNTALRSFSLSLYLICSWLTCQTSSLVVYAALWSEYTGTVLSKGLQPLLLPSFLNIPNTIIYIHQPSQSVHNHSNSEVSGEGVLHFLWLWTPVSIRPN